MATRSIRDLVNEAYRECGLAAYDYDLDPEELQTAVTRLRGMMGTWERKWSIQIGFNFGGELDDDSGIGDDAAEAVYLNLGMRLAPGFGKTLDPQTMANAKDALAGLLNVAARSQQVQQPRTLPRGAGAKTWRMTRPFNPPPFNDPMLVDDGGDLDIV